jgi:hypothetical protein
VSPVFGHRPPKPDPALLARVSDTAEVDLGTYPEDALAVLGAYPARGGLDHKDEGVSAFRRLDGQARKAAMQAALDRLIADGTLSLPAGSRLKDVVADGLDGKLEVNGPIADLYRLSFWFHRRGFESSAVVNMMTTDEMAGVQMPYGVSPPGLELCYGVPPPDGGAVSVLLVERRDNEASTRAYALRTPRQEFTRMAAFLFADVLKDSEALRTDAILRFRFGQASLKVETNFIRMAGEESAHGRMTTEIPRKKKQEEPTFVKVSATDLVDVLTKYFSHASGRTQ